MIDQRVKKKSFPFNVMHNFCFLLLSVFFFIFIFKYFFILPELQTPPLLSHFTFPPTAIPLPTPYIPLLHSFTILHILYHPSTSAFTNDTPLLSSSISPPPTSPTFPLIYPFLLSSIFCLWCILLYVGIMYATQIYFLFIFNCFRFSLSLSLFRVECKVVYLLIGGLTVEDIFCIRNLL